MSRDGNSRNTTVSGISGNNNNPKNRMRRSRLLSWKNIFIFIFSFEISLRCEKRANVNHRPRRERETVEGKVSAEADYLETSVFYEKNIGSLR